MLYLYMYLYTGMLTIANALFYLPKAPSGIAGGLEALDGERDGLALVCPGKDLSSAPATCWPWIESSEWT